MKLSKKRGMPEALITGIFTELLDVLELSRD